MGNYMAKKTAKDIARKNGLDVEHALYRKSGDWYHTLRAFPGALLDDNGYIRFNTEADYNEFIKREGIHEKKATNTLIIKKARISQFSNYIRFSEVSEFPEENVLSQTVVEGAKLRIIVNSYERDTSARKICLEKWGFSCVVCNFNFEREFGIEGKGFIHVHHLTPISSIKKEYVLDPERELRPVCPNCHSMLHRKEPPLSVEELRALRKKREIK